MTEPTGPRSQIERDIEAGRVGLTVDDDGNTHSYERTSWYTVDLEPVKRGEVAADQPAFLARDDGRQLIYPGRAHSFFGPSESLKTWAALLACRSVLDSQLAAVFIDFEDDRVSFVDRCRTLHIPEAAIGSRLAYIRPDEPLVTFDRRGRSEPGNAMLDLNEVVLTLSPALIVLDGVSEVYALHGWDTYRAEDVTTYQRLLLKQPGAATIEVDHTPHGQDRQIGSQHKRAGLDGAAYGFKAVTNGGRGGTSTADITVAKDRHGMVRAWATKGAVGRFHLEPDTAEIRAPSYAEAMGRNVELEREVAEWLGANPGASKRAVREVKLAGQETVDDILRILEVEGYIRNAGSGSRHAYHLIKPYGK